MANGLSQDKALIFRITHQSNVSWILENGFHCASSGVTDPTFTSIGSADLIVKRASRDIVVGPEGTLNDYIPFYFTPYSPMMYNIKTGYGDIKQQANEDIVIFVSSLHHLEEHDVDFVFSDRHAYLQTAEFYTDTDELDKLDWVIIKNRDFRRDPNDPGKVERYQAEALAFGHVPVEALIGLICYNNVAKTVLQNATKDAALELHVKPGWYF